jgi:hypothetical protein
MIIARSDLVTTVPHALGVYFSRLSPELCLVRLPFDIAGFDLKQHWHRKYHSDSRNRWLRQQVAQLFNDQTDEYQVDWKLPPRTPSSRA